MRVSNVLRKYSHSETNWKNCVNQFIKLIHPDKFNDAPDFISKANNAALKDFNTYIHCLSTSQPAPQLKIQFYTKQKDYSSNTLQLDEITPNMSKEKMGSHINKLYFSQSL